MGIAAGFKAERTFMDLLRQPFMQRCTCRTWTRACTLRHKSARSRAYFHIVSANKSSVAPLEQHYTDQVKGKRFSCTECGKCCTGKGEIWLNSLDISRIADHLDIKTATFISGYTKAYSRKAGFWLLRSKRNATQDCILLKDGLCSVHDVKPLQCMTYPWWPDLMAQSNWEFEREQVCEGMDHEIAQECDALEAAAKLQAATEFFAERDASRPARHSSM